MFSSNKFNRWTVLWNIKRNHFFQQLLVYLQHGWQLGWPCSVLRYMNMHWDIYWVTNLTFTVSFLKILFILVLFFFIQINLWTKRSSSWNIYLCWLILKCTRTNFILILRPFFSALSFKPSSLYFGIAGSVRWLRTSLSRNLPVGFYQHLQT